MRRQTQIACPMKTIIRYISLSIMLLLPATSFAGQPADPIPRILRNITVSYQLNTLYPKDLDNVSFNGGGIGYQMDFSVSDKHPLYIGTGVNMMVTTRSKTYYDDAQYNLVNIKQRTTFINFNIPVNFNVRLPLYGGWSVTPFAGLNFRVQAYGHNKYRVSGGPVDTDLNAVLYRLDLGPADGNLFSREDYGEAHLHRFQMGWQIGVKLQYRRVNMQVTYGSDFIKLHKNLGSSNLNVTLGYTL